jgi:scyllo-inositol 2-dehydrogenase (NADP+)
MESPLGVVICGYGLAGRVFHAPLIAATQGLVVRAIITANPERREQAAADFPDAALLASPEELWTRLEELGVQLAVVAGANVTHVPLTLAALERGLHVVVDKPIAPTAVSAGRITDVAAAANRLVIPFQNRRWDSDFLTAIETVEAGHLGTVHRLESRFERFRPTPTGKWRESADLDAMGGVLYDFGAHLVDQAVRLLGPVNSVTTSARSIRDRDLADDETLFTLNHTSGAISLLFASMVSAFDAPRMVILGSAGGLRIEAGDTQEDALRAGISANADDWGIEPDSSHALLRTADGTGTVDSQVVLTPGRWPSFYPAVRNAIIYGSEPPVLLSDVIANLRIIDAARESAATGQSVTLDPPAGHKA